MPYKYAQSFEEMQKAVASNDRYVVIFSVNENDKTERLAHFSDELDVFRPFEGRSCFVKPNIVSSEGYPTTTDPEVLRLVLERLKDRCSRLEGGDCSAAGSPLDHILAEVASGLDVPFYDLNGGETEMMGRVPIYTYPKQFDSVVSLPVLKEHFVTGMTFALKNNFGFPAKKVRIPLHMRKSKLNQCIADLHREYNVDFVVGDACRTMRRAQEKRWGGRQEPFGLFFFSNAPLELDLLAWKLMPKRKVKHLELAREMCGEQEVLVWIEPEAIEDFNFE